MVCLRLATNCPSTSCPTRRRSVLCWILAELTGQSTAPLPCTLLKTVVSVFWLCTFLALWIVLWATHGLPSRASVYRGGPCWDPWMCLDSQGGIKAKRRPFLWLLDDLVDVSWWSKRQLDFTALLLYVFRVQQQLFIHGHWNVRKLTTRCWVEKGGNPKRWPRCFWSFSWSFVWSRGLVTRFT